MNIQDVIEAGEFSFWGNIQNYVTSFPFDGFGSYLVFIVFVFVVLFIIFFSGAIITIPCYKIYCSIMRKIKKEPINDEDHMGLSILVIFLSGFLVFLFLLQFSEVQGNQQHEWKNEHVIPYLQSLPGVKKDVQSLQVPNEIGGESTFLDKTSSEPLYVSLVYTNAEGIAKKLDTHALVHYTLSEGDTPYFQGKYVSKSLGHRLEKGYYNVHVYLPKNYTLNYQ